MNVVEVSVKEFNTPEITILIGILIVMITIAGLYFHKNFKIMKRIEDKANCSSTQTSPDLNENPVDAKECQIHRLPQVHRVSVLLACRSRSALLMTKRKRFLP